MNKICLLYSFKPSSWVSCQKIVSNLAKSYQLMGEVTCISYSEDMDEFQLIKSGQEIIKLEPTHIVFLDHKPHPYMMLNGLLPILKAVKNIEPRLIFHLYGDFTLTTPDWEKLEKVLTGRHVHWYAASDRQLAMLTSFIPEDQMTICPFPVDTKDFFRSPELRNSFRKKMKWADDEKVFLFTGRLSRQKRIHQLIRTFADWRRETGAKARLILVGDTDKVGEPYLQKSEWEGEYFHKLLGIYNSLPETEKKYISFEGFKPNEELNAYYNSADCLVNISVHNDEDYGMSCAEALATGLPMIVTNWAGLISFRRPPYEDSVSLVPVRISPKGKLIKLSVLRESFDKFYQNPDVNERELIAASSLQYTGIKNVAAIVKKNLNSGKIFQGFKPLLHEASGNAKYQFNNTFYDMKKKRFNELYFKIYRHYVE